LLLAQPVPSNGGAEAPRAESVQTLLFKHQRIALELADHPIARHEIPTQDLLRQGILDLRLDGALQRAGAVDRIEAGLTDLVARRIVEE